MVGDLARYQQIMNEKGPDSPEAALFRRERAGDPEMDEMLEDAYLLAKRCERVTKETHDGTST